MSTGEETQSKLLPHHEQKDLCTTRLPYRQGRKLTAVKVYTINNESKHLLIFGVPSLNLRQETKGLFMKFGKLLQFNVTKYPSEQFTETYHAIYENIHSARIAKKMLDTKNYYGGILHICYAPELETAEEVREKLLSRKAQVIGRLKNLEREENLAKQDIEKKIENRLKDVVQNQDDDMKGEMVRKMYMGDVNEVNFGKRKMKNDKTKVKKAKLKSNKTDDINSKPTTNESGIIESSQTDVSGPSNIDTPLNNIDVIDFTSPNTTVISNINEALNYNNFGSEIIRKVPPKPVNRIKFNINKKS